MVVKIKYSSFFSGCGGLDLGLNGGFDYLNKHYERTGLTSVFANDIDKKACKTYRENFQHNIHNDSIDNIDFSEIQADLVVGGFPCQPFSYAGKRLGENDDRGKLYWSMLKAVKVINPKIFLMENVKGLLDIDEGKTMSSILENFCSLGYNVNYQLYEACNYGIPQSRSRVFIVGLKANIFSNVFFKHPQETHEKVTAFDSLDDLKKLPEGAIANHFWSKAKKNKGQGNTTIPKDGFAPTIRAEHHGNIEFHYDNHRRLSAREAARIESFPDNFVFYDSTSNAYRQIGNAVPPVLGWYIGKEIASFLKAC